MNLSIIIPTYKGRNLLKEGLPKFFNALKKIQSYEVVVIDNNSDDNTEEYIQSYKEIKYIKLEKNYGFTKAVNLGAKEAKGEYILILNNDCFVEDNIIVEMIKFLDNNKNYVATQPVVYYKDNQIENIGYVVDLWKGKTEPISDIDHQVLSIKYKVKNIFKQRYLYGLSATCLLIRREVFMKIGMFDESFHSYLEDVDLFIRLAKAGYRFGPTLNTRCYHLHMATSSKMGLYKQKQDLKNWIRIIIKNYPLWFIILHLLTIFIERLRNMSGLIKKLLKY